MRLLSTILILVTVACYGQSVEETVYDWKYVIKFVRKNKMNATKATKEIISEISKKYEGEKEQTELIKFYKGTYDYNIVNKGLLKNLIDSISQNGLGEEIRSFARESRDFIKYRFLNKKMMDFEFPDKNGNLVRLTSLNDKIVIIELWTTWCKPCVKEMHKIPELKKLNPNIEFYSISLDKSAGKMKKFIDNTQYDWPIVFGGDHKLNRDLFEYLNIVAIPKYYIVNRVGIVINVADKLDEQFIANLK